MPRCGCSAIAGRWNTGRTMLERIADGLSAAPTLDEALRDWLPPHRNTQRQQ
jgi:hypothetical protein